MMGIGFTKEHGGGYSATFEDVSICVRKRAGPDFVYEVGVQCDRFGPKRLWSDTDAKSPKKALRAAIGTAEQLLVRMADDIRRRANQLQRTGDGIADTSLALVASD